ncbi:MAG: Alkane 1-monooxygenase [Cyanobacteria bacterium RYN_339]|nr:Alkane 1-monooxygenase [Cyanobacteria bacterium RYN_339]
MPVPFLIIFVPVALAVLGQHLGGAWTFLTPAFVFGLVPLLDLVLGRNKRNPDPERPPSLLLHRLVAHLAAPVLVALVIWAAWTVTHVRLTPLELVGLALSVGICTGGIGITVAHELIHKASKLDRRLGQVLLLNVGYMHFYIEHLIGHHGRVATPEDPASARLGESFYRFYPRTVLGSWLSAWRIEGERLQRLGLPGLHWRNQMLWFVALPLAYGASLTAFGWQAFPFFLVQCLVGFSLLELVNYLEHYGLERQPLENGRFERVTIMHSWSSAQRLTNYFLVNLQRHSDHHVNAAKPYPLLLHIDEAPQLPTGYAGMVMLALVPPLFRRVMDPRVAAVRSGH